MQNPAIEVINLGKKYNRRRDPERSVKSFILGNLFKKKLNDEFFALRNIHFSVGRGETLGIIGANGAGKSTLLSLIAGTTAPSEGEVRVNGKMSTLLELGAGFHPDLTGRENVFLNASILGMSRKETEEKYQEIVELAGIGDAIDSPVKFYSSGMYVRLGFAVAVMCDPDILLMDEVMAVGDEGFRKKSLARVEKFKATGKTMLIISHDLETIKKMADRVLLLNQGKLMGLGEPIEIVENYKNFGVYQDGNVTVKDFGTREVVIENVIFKSGGLPVKEEIPSSSPLEIYFDLKKLKRTESLVAGFSISDNMGNTLFGTNTQILKQTIKPFEGTKQIAVKIPALQVQHGIYYFSLAVHSEDHRVQYHRLDNAFKFKVGDATQGTGIMVLPCSMEVES